MSELLTRAFAEPPEDDLGMDETPKEEPGTGDVEMESGGEGGDEEQW